jgi:S-adenosyl methyltransferase
MGGTRLNLRSREEISRFFSGLDLVEPGLVPMPEWRAQADPAHVIPCYAGVGRKP